VPLRFLITAGPTREPLDPVRFLSNPSSGRMGYALAQAASAAGHTVHLITGPTHISPPEVQALTRVTTAQEMWEAVSSQLDSSDVLIMAAAVADYRPKVFTDKKIKKGDGPITLELERTPDILLSAARTKAQRLHVGFAAETGDLIENARAKLEAKALDLIVANDVTEAGSGFGTDTNRATLLWRDGRIEALPQMTKLDLAAHIIQSLVDHYGN